MASEASITHSVQGRLRIRIPSRKRDEAYFAAVKDAISAVEGVDGVEVTPQTGSVLVFHHTDAGAIRQAGVSKDLFEIGEAPKVQNTILHDSISAQVSEINSRIREFSEGGVDLRGLAFFALVGTGIYQIARGNFTAPAWYTAFWYALGLLGKTTNNGSSAGKESPE
jgi:copper chaperone CopZ